MRRSTAQRLEREVPAGPSGADVLAGDDPEAVQWLLEESIKTAELAREDPCVFIEFVIKRFDHPELPIFVAPHQRVMVDFIRHHDRCCVMAPVGASKTLVILGLTLWMLGKNPDLRGAVVSAAEEQASGILGLVRDYIESSPELRLVFPHLVRSPKDGDPWTQTAITVQRPAGIKDPSLIAIGLDSKVIVGKRLNWILLDDLLNDENTLTKESREKVIRQLDLQVLSRLDPVGAKVIFTNTPWHPEDAIHECERRGWATMRMDAHGDITVYDDADAEEPWDSPHLRPANDNGGPECRLVAHDPDPDNLVELWPERLDWKHLQQRQRDLLPQRYNQLYRSQCRDDGSSMCKSEYVEACLKKAREMGIHGFVHEYTGANATFTGVDLAVSPGEESDDVAFFTFEARPNGLKVILDIEVGKWSGPEIVEKLFDKHRRYNSIIRVENNAAQDFIRQFALARDLSIPVKGHMTGRVKAHPEHGVPALFVEMSNGAWAFPCGKRGEKHPALSRFIDECLYYTPARHTGDVLMANYFAREQAKKFGLLNGDGTQDAGDGRGRRPRGQGIASSIMAR